MFVTADERRQGHGRLVLAELERRAAADGARRARVLTTEVLSEARELYAVAGYAEAEVLEVGGRRDFWLEKTL